jgi:hypothetical protein
MLIYGGLVDNETGGRQSDKKVGKMEIKSYASPSKRFTPKNKTTLDFSDEGGCFLLLILRRS